MLTGKKIILGVTGSIAAYKSAMLIRLLVKQGAEVKVIMTESAKDFITPLTLATLSKNPVLSSYANKETGEWHNHVELAMWADYLLIAPASANTIAKMANGVCDNLLLAAYLSCPQSAGRKTVKHAVKVMIAPAMDLDMYAHSTTRRNLQTLKKDGVEIITPGTGELASGLVGEGRMAEPEEIVAILGRQQKKSSVLAGKTALVSAGPTYEAIDPVRFIGNHSTGKMGFAVAEALAEAGVKVTLVAGPNNLSVKHPGISLVSVTSAEEMYKACMKNFKHVDIAVMSAAVADFTPQKKIKEKIKKETKFKSLELVPTKDILGEMGKHKNGSMLVGFALETQNEVLNAKKKLQNKNLDFVVLNSLKDAGSGFGYDTNKVTIVDKKGTKKFPLKSKADVAKEIVLEIEQRIRRKK